MSLQEKISISKDIILSFAAILTVIIGFVGLQTWRKKLKGKTEYELARRFIRALYKVRGGFDHVRDRLISGAELPEEYSKNVRTTLPREDYKAFLFAFENRWKYFIECFQELESEALEAEVIWGSDIQFLMRSIRVNKYDLLFTIQEHLSFIDSPPQDEDGRKEVKEIKEQLFGTIDGKDPTSESIKKSISDLEEKIKPYLQHNS